MSESQEAVEPPWERPRFLRLRLVNFLSYRDATIEFDDLVALVGPNASGKSNAVAAIKLLREIPFHGLPTAIARRGGFDQLRHRSKGRPYNPSLRLEFRLGGSAKDSFYEIKLGALQGKRYEVRETGFTSAQGVDSTFSNDRGTYTYRDTWPDGDVEEQGADQRMRIPVGQSAIAAGGFAYSQYLISQVLQRMQTVEVNPARVGELQEPSSVREFEPDGSNTASVFENLSASSRAELTDQLAAIVPGIAKIDVRRFADKVTLVFFQDTGEGATREFLAKQMSDGTLRAFSILLSIHQANRPQLLVIEEPEVAIHLGALATVTEILQNYAEETQILITTHSADIVDLLDVSDLRVVWSSHGESRTSVVAEHTVDVVRSGLITPGSLLRADSLDPAAP